MRFRRIAVTGASGYLGRLLVGGLAGTEGIDRVLAIDIRPLMGDIPQNVVYVKRDVTEPMADLLIKHRIEAVAHLAFVIQPDRNAARASRVNVGGASSVLDACAAAEVRHVLYMSSATVYGAHADNPPMLTEDAPLRPVRGFQYSEAKVSVEACLPNSQRSILILECAYCGRVLCLGLARITSWRAAWEGVYSWLRRASIRQCNFCSMMMPRR